MPPQTSAPIYANYPAEKLTIGAGPAIFHLATERVVVVSLAIDIQYNTLTPSQSATTPKTSAGSCLKAGAMPMRLQDAVPSGKASRKVAIGTDSCPYR